MHIWRITAAEVLEATDFRRLILYTVLCRTLILRRTITREVLTRRIGSPTSAFRDTDTNGLWYDTGLALSESEVESFNRQTAVFEARALRLKKEGL
jgi:hypothetical protein